MSLAFLGRRFGFIVRGCATPAFSAARYALRAPRGLRVDARAFVVLFALAACSRASERTVAGPPPQLPAQRPRQVSPSPAEWYWEPVQSVVRGAVSRPIDGAVAESAIARVEGGARIWTELREGGRERLRRDGVVVLGAPPSGRPPLRSMGAFYTELRDQRVPYVITLDALFALVDLGLGRALAEIEETDFAPAFEAFLAKLEARVAAEAHGASVELAAGYATAHGLVAVACALANPKYVPPRALAAVVADERGRVLAHAGPATSPLLGVSMDYARFAVPSGASRPGTFRALAWLAGAPIAIVARSEEPGAPVTAYEARRNTRAAMLLARLVDRDVDIGIHGLYSKIKRLLAFVSGPSDDVSLLELDEIATGASIDLTKPASIANVVHVDRVRWAAHEKRAPLLYDGAGAASRAGLSVRLFGGHASADSVALQALMGSAVGQAREGAAADRVRSGLRMLPSTLDVAAWLGAPEARALLKDRGADAFEGFDAALAAASKTRPNLDSSQLHASVHGSLVDALAAWATPESRTSALASTASDRSRVESLLSAWTFVRRASQPLSRPKPLPPRPTHEVRASGSPLPVFVEASPDVVARLVSTMRQIRKGLVALGPLGPASPSHALLVEIEDILQVALRAAERLAGAEALTPEEAAALALLPTRIANAEDSSGVEARSASVVVARDPIARRALVSATGVIEPAVILVRDPGRDGFVLAVGAHIAHHEKTLSYDKVDVSDSTSERSERGAANLTSERSERGGANLTSERSERGGANLTSERSERAVTGAAVARMDDTVRGSRASWVASFRMVR